MAPSCSHLEVVMKAPQKNLQTVLLPEETLLLPADDVNEEKDLPRFAYPAYAIFAGCVRGPRLVLAYLLRLSSGQSLCVLLLAPCRPRRVS